MLVENRRGRMCAEVRRDVQALRGGEGCTAGIAEGDQRCLRASPPRQARRELVSQVRLRGGGTSRREVAVNSLQPGQAHSLPSMQAPTAPIAPGAAQQPGGAAASTHDHGPASPSEHTHTARTTAQAAASQPQPTVHKPHSDPCQPRPTLHDTQPTGSVEREHPPQGRTRTSKHKLHDSSRGARRKKDAQR